ncbi:MAG TPA: hypothetical protein VIL49_13835 [Capillimicrobium sp.]|jgi:hypothetical protein
MRRATVLLSLVLTLVVAACGGSDGGGTDVVDLGVRAQAPEGLTGPSLGAVDFVEVRRQLGVPEDQGFGPDPERRQEAIVLSSTAASVLPFVRVFVKQLVPTPMYEAFDGGAISAAAGPVAGEGGTYLLATSQSFDEIAERLGDAGFEEADGVLTGADVPEGSDATGDQTWSVLDAGDGVVVIADSPEAARAAADGEGDDARREALEAVEQPVRYVGIADPADAGDCTLRFLAVGQDARPPDGEVVLAPVEGEEQRIAFDEPDGAAPGSGPGLTEILIGEAGDERVCPDT